MKSVRWLIGCALLLPIVLGVEDEKVSQTDDVPYLSPKSHPSVFFAEHFDDSSVYERKWIKSSAKKDGTDEAIAKYDGVWSLEQAVKDPLSGDFGLVLKSKAKHAAISSKLNKPFSFEANKPLIVQYEINFQNGQDCGGGYLKLLTQSSEFEPKNFNDKTPYTIMFGPDKCGSESKFHFIFRHVNPKNGTISEKHVKKLETKERSTFEEILKSKRPHLYRLVLNPDLSYEMSIDYKIFSHGSLLNDFEPPVNPPAEIDDPSDFKPEDWDEREKISDVTAKKPEDWDESEPKLIEDSSAYKPSGWLDDEPAMIPDPSAEKPEDWDESIDGEWEAALVDNPACSSAPGCGEWKVPMIDNPKYKGKWVPPLTDNPNYKGKWKPKKIPNPHYYHDGEPFKRMTSIGGIGIELWSMSDDIYFDNIYLTDNMGLAGEWASNTFDLKIKKLDANDAGLFRRILTYSNRNPWLYAVYVVVVGLPLVLIITFCCSWGEPKKSDPKKTDDVQEDDDFVAGESENVEDENANEEEEEEEKITELSDTDDETPILSSEKKNSPRRRRARKE